MPPAPQEGDLYEQLRAVRLAKDLFLSSWYREACETLNLNDEACQVLEDVRRDTAEENRQILEIMQEWSNRERGDAESGRAAREVARNARIEFFHTLAESKEAAGLGIERAAHMAPPKFENMLLDAAAIDFRHATRLRKLLEQEYLDMRRHRERPSGAAAPE